MQSIADGYQVTDATPNADGSIATDVVDNFGSVVATVTRLPDGTSEASVFDSSDSSDWSSILGKVTGFLENVASTAKNASNEVTRISNAAKGAMEGARVGYNLPTDLRPILIGGGVVLGVLVLASALNNPPRRRR